jgi:predicted pyridoxine 5'-phosphate oxidase superfamily flavin-nucleotide-binding protein
MTLTEPVLEDLRRAAQCWFATEDARGRPNIGARDAWAVLDAEAVVLADTLSPVTARNLRVNPWAVAGFLDGTGRAGWRIEGPARTLSPGVPGFAEAALRLAEGGAAAPRRILRLDVVRVGRISVPDVPLLPDRATKGLALLRAFHRGRGEGSGAMG